MTPSLAAPVVGTKLPRDCPVCGAGAGHRIVYRKWGYPILKCDGCGLGSTMADGFDAASYYTADYFRGGHRDGYGDYAGSRPVLAAEFRKVLDDLVRHGCRGGRLLEVGSAYGYFLEEAKTRFDAIGIEICDDAVADAQARGLNAHGGVLTDEFAARHGPFDATVMLDVIEHLPDPAGTLHTLAAATKPGGLLLLSTGDWGSPLARLIGRRWRLMTPPQHLYFHTRRTLTKLVVAAGFRVVSCRSPWKHVPIGLIGYQLSRRLGVRLPLPRWLHPVGVPANLFDAVRLIARKELA